MLSVMLSLSIGLEQPKERKKASRSVAVSRKSISHTVRTRNAQGTMKVKHTCPYVRPTVLTLCSTYVVEDGCEIGHCKCNLVLMTGIRPESSHLFNREQSGLVSSAPQEIFPVPTYTGFLSSSSLYLCRYHRCYELNACSICRSRVRRDTPCRARTLGCKIVSQRMVR
eukprot:8675447-Pyramimonas_sp.AAC.1